MKATNKLRNRRLIGRGALYIGVASAISAILSLLAAPLVANNQTIADFVSSLGGFGPAVFILLEAVNATFPVVTGQPFEVAGGVLFGWWGLVLSLIGSLLGAAIIFLLVRRFGRPWVEKRVKPATLKQFDFVFADNGGFGLFICSLVPFLPDDIITYGGGLTKVSFWKYLGILAISRPVALAINTGIGVGMSQGNIIGIVAIIATVSFLMFLFMWRRQQLMSWLRRIVKKDSV